MEQHTEGAPSGTAAVALRWAAGAVVLYAVLLGVFAAHYSGPEWFLHLGHNNRANLEFARKEFGPDVVVPHHDGHDGRYFWALARDPLLVHPRFDARLVDRPVYRFQRVAYPLVAAPWRAFGERALLWGLIVTNLVIAGAGTFIAVLLALEVGAPARASLAFALNPAVLIAALGDLSDALAVAALLLAVLLVLRRRIGWALLAGAVAGLAKEPMLLGVLALAAFAPRLTRRQRLAVIAVPAAAVAAWALYIRWRLGWPATSIQEFTGPFVGFVDAWRHEWSKAGSWTDAIAALALVPFAVATVVRWWHRRTLLLGIALQFVLLVPFLTAQVLDILLNSVRAVGPAITLVWIDLYARAWRAGVD